MPTTTQAKHGPRRVLSSLVLCAAVGAALAACQGNSADAKPAVREEPVSLTPVPGSSLKQLSLTPRAVERLGLRTAGAGPSAVPYAAVLYDARGAAWVYAATGPNSYVRRPITVVRVEGDRVAVGGGPAAGTQVVTVGAAELYGAELGVGH
jgi:hypothetical protein